MEMQKLQELRKRQWGYTNLVFIILLALFYLLIYLELSSRAVYFLLGIAFLLVPINSWIFKRPQPWLTLFPGMKELVQYEKEKLQDSWRHYYTASAILFSVFSIFFFVQALFRSDRPFMEGIPFWYLIVVPVILLLIGNLNIRFHIRRMDNKTPEQLKVFAYERMLFTTVFASVVLAMTLLGALIYWFLFL